jgi:hypothetical protein
MATCLVFFVESRQLVHIVLSLILHSFDILFFFGYTSGMAGMPGHAENIRPQTSKSSHLIYCEILRVFLRGFAWFMEPTHRAWRVCRDMPRTPPANL